MHNPAMSGRELKERFQQDVGDVIMSVKGMMGGPLCEHGEGGRRRREGAKIAIPVG